MCARIASPSRNCVRALILTAVAVVVSLIATDPALATTPDCGIASTSSNCYAGHQDILANSAPYLGGHMTTHMVWMKSGPSSAAQQNHINSVLWVYMDAGANYVEGGLRDGYVYPPTSQTNPPACDAVTPGSPAAGGLQVTQACLITIYEQGSGASATCLQFGCGAYTVYWEDRSVSGTTWNTYFHIVKFASPNPTATVFVDIYNNGSTWQINFTGTVSYTGYSSLYNAWSRPYAVKTGGEIHAPPNNGECMALEQTKFGIWVDPRYSIYWPVTSSSASGPGTTIPNRQDAPFFINGYSTTAGTGEFDYSTAGSCP